MVAIPASSVKEVMNSHFVPLSIDKGFQIRSFVQFRPMLLRHGTFHLVLDYEGSYHQ